HILANHPELDMSVRTLYSYLDQGLFTARNIDLKRKVHFKPRKCHKTQITDRAVFSNRLYHDFCSLALTGYVQMDTVQEVLNAFQLRPIAPDEVNLTPKLIRFNH